MSDIVKTDRYNGLVSELAKEFNLSRPTVIKYLENHYDKQICVDVRTRAIEKFQKHKANIDTPSEQSQMLFSQCQTPSVNVPVFYIKGSKKLGLYTGITSHRIHEQWRREGLAYCIDDGGNFLYRTDNIVKFIENKYKPQQINIKQPCPSTY